MASTPPQPDISSAKEPLETSSSPAPSATHLESTATNAPRALPLRPSLIDRLSRLAPVPIVRLYHRVLPQPTYVFFSRLSIRRRTLFVLILVFLFIVLLLVILLSTLLTRHRSSAHKVSFPSSGSIHRGDGTYYNPALGACGIESTDNDHVAAVSLIVFDAASSGSNPNANPLCGRKIRVRRLGGDKAIEVTMIDRCTGCKEEDLDMSPAAFDHIAAREEGRVGVEWTWA